MKYREYAKVDRDSLRSFIKDDNLKFETYARALEFILLEDRKEFIDYDNYCIHSLSDFIGADDVIANRVVERFHKWKVMVDNPNGYGYIVNDKIKYKMVIEKSNGE